MLMLQIYKIIIISSDWIFHPNKMNIDDNEWQQFYFWMLLEFCFFISYIFACATFLFIRGFFNQAVFLRAPAAIEDKSTDFLDANKILTGFMCAVTSPAIVACCIWWRSGSYYNIHQTEQTVFFVIMCIQIFQAGSIFVLTFTQHYLYMEEHNELIPKFLYTLQFAVFLVLPIICSLLSMYIWLFHPEGNCVLQPWFTLIGIQGVAMTIWYLYSVWGIVEDLVEGYEDAIKEEKEDMVKLAKMLKEEESRKMVESVVTYLTEAIKKKELNASTINDSIAKLKDFLVPENLKKKIRDMF